jgi:hypothetical protein
MFSRARKIFAALYCAFVVFVFVGLNYADPGWAEGGIPLIVVRLPWSIPAILIGAGFSLIPGVDKIMATEGGNFFIFVVICGGLNAAFILGASRVLRLLRDSERVRAITVVVAAVLVSAAQMAMPSIDRDALERSRPPNVRKEAVHVGPAIGWWQYCIYDPEQDADTCRIWNRGGLILEEGEFVPYDGGSSAKADALQISDVNSGPDRIGLLNGRILIPKTREAEMKRFLDGLTGKRETC